MQRDRPNKTTPYLKMKESATDLPQKSSRHDRRKNKSGSRAHHRILNQETSYLEECPGGTRVTHSPQTTEYTDCKDAFSKYGNASPTSDSILEESRKAPPMTESIHAEDSPTWIGIGSGTYFSESLSDQSLHTAFPADNDTFQLSTQERQGRQNEEIRKVVVDTFSFTNSEEFEISQLRDAHIKPTSIIQQPSHMEYRFKESSISGTSVIEQMKFEEESEHKKVRPARKSVLKTMFLIILFISLLISLYFAIFGSYLSFQLYYGSLSDEQKQQLKNYLQVASLSDANTLKFSALKVQKTPITMSGLTYAPRGANEPNCKYSREDAIRDLTLVSSISRKIKTYGAQCQQMDHILYAIETLKLDLDVTMGVWLGADPLENEIQLLKAKSTLLKANADRIKSVLIGHESLKRSEINELTLISHIKSFRKFLYANDIEISVGTSESPPFVTQRLVDACDIIGFTISPFLAGVESDEAARWSSKRFLNVKEKFFNEKTSFFISEIGWPYQGGRFKQAEASPADYHRFMYSWLETESKLISDDWFCFEAFDEPWKIRFNEAPEFWETQWGVFGQKKKQKLNSAAWISNQR